MKIPAVFTGRWLCAGTVVATLVFVATTSQADPAIDEDVETLAIAGPAELEALANQYAALDERLTARTELELEALGYEATRGNPRGLTLAHDSGMTGSAALLRGARRDGRSTDAAPELEILAADRSWKILITSIPVTEDAPPASPLR